VGRRSGRLVRLGTSAVLISVIATGCSRAGLEDKLRFGWPRGITDQAREMRVLWTWSSVAALAVGVVVWGLIFWSVIVYRRRGDELPKQTKYGLPIELFYTVMPFLIVAVLFFYTAVSETNVTKLTANPDTTITVVGFKWNWEFDYADQRDPQTRELVYTVGTASEIPILVIPEGKRVRFIEHSSDVVHSFWVPEFLFKRDVFPLPQENQFEITADQRGSYVGRCAELCGTYHSQMNFEVRVVSEDDYRRYLTALAGFGNADPDRQAKAMTAIGQPPRATTTYPFDTNRTERSASERSVSQGQSQGQQSQGQGGG
jgi:cytochrome c oxidase subunit 2